MVLTDRDAHLVRDCADFQVLTRVQMTRLGHFGSKTRANAVLLRLVRFGYLSRRYQPAVAGSQRALYFPGPEAHRLLNHPAELVGRERRRIQTLSDLFLAHQLLITDVRLSFHAAPSCRLDRWLTDADLRPLNLGVIPDGHVEYTHEGRRFGAFLELDRGTESLSRWKAKVTAYVQLAQSGRYLQVFGRQFFRVLVVAPSPVRVEHLRQCTATVTDKVFWLTRFAALIEQGPFGPIWRRPVEASPQPLSPR
jgi:hypothetical protein